MATATVVPLADGPAGVVEVGRPGWRTDGCTHDDLPLGRVDEADAEPVDLGQPLRGRAPLGVDADQEPLGVEAEPDALEQPLGRPASSSRARCRRRSGRASIHSK